MALAATSTMLVGVRANVIQLLSVDDRNQLFTMVFTVHFEWDDPLLKDFKREVFYWKPVQALLEGEFQDSEGALGRKMAACRRRAKLQKAKGSDTTGLALEVDLKMDFAEGDVVESLVPITDNDGKTHDSPLKGRVRTIDESSDGQINFLSVAWTLDNKGYEFTSKVHLGDVQIIPPAGHPRIGDDKVHVELPLSCFINKIEPDWDADPFLFKPQWSIENQVGELQTLVHDKKLLFVSEKGGHVFEKFKFQATFHEPLRLQDFPFDKHALTIRFTAEEDASRQLWYLLPGAEKAGTCSRFHVEWSVSKECKLKVYPLRWFNGIALHQFRVQTYVERNTSFHEKHVVPFMFTICSCSVMVLSVGPDKPVERAGILLTVLLVMAGYKHMTSDWIPRVQYYTYMDKYVMFGFCLQAAVAIESMFLVLTFCKDVSDFDGKVDGFLHHSHGTLAQRAAPDFECERSTDDFDAHILYVLYGLWMVPHILLYLFKLVRFCLSAFSSCQKRTSSRGTEKAELPKMEVPSERSTDRLLSPLEFAKEIGAADPEASSPPVQFQRKPASTTKRGSRTEALQQPPTLLGRFGEEISSQHLKRKHEFKGRDPQLEATPMTIKNVTCERQFALACEYEEGGDYEAALEHFEKSLSVAEKEDPDHPDVVMLLKKEAQMLARLGDEETAQSCYEEASLRSTSARSSRKEVAPSRQGEASLRGTSTRSSHREATQSRHEEASLRSKSTRSSRKEVTMNCDEEASPRSASPRSASPCSSRDAEEEAQSCYTEAASLRSSSTTRSSHNEGAPSRQEQSSLRSKSTRSSYKDEAQSRQEEMLVRSTPTFSSYEEAAPSRHAEASLRSTSTRSSSASKDDTLNESQSQSRKSKKTAAKKKFKEEPSTAYDRLDDDVV
eukprot:TRINITY_DN10299_c1_g1_i9.p1 TRINITY_DN10299_c1_g1~~TRINITY_DN10299_c1_g1_i9.p1  ORF type:complete len:918 (-),score=165.31 TRINITY_DN10299_c1_g1_i9:74-2761(-)